MTRDKARKILGRILTYKIGIRKINDNCYVATSQAGTQKLYVMGVNKYTTGLMNKLEGTKYTFERKFYFSNQATEHEEFYLIKKDAAKFLGIDPSLIVGENDQR